jgi:hypothetical protein
MVPLKISLIMAPIPHTLSDVWPLLRQSLGPEAELAIRRRLLSFSIRTAAVDRQRLAIITRPGPPMMGAGWWLPELVELCGGTLVGAVKGAAPALLPDTALDEADLILVAISGQSLNENIGIALQLPLPRGKKLFACDALRRFDVVDGQLEDSAGIIAGLLHGDAALGLGLRGRLWQQV